MEQEKKVIYPKGKMFILTLIFNSLILIGSIYIFFAYLFDKSKPNIYRSPFFLIISILGVFIFSFDIANQFKKNMLVFNEANELIKLGSNGFNCSCLEIVDYKITPVVIQFMLKESKVIYLRSYQYSSSQIKEILLEIQKRGGLVNKQIDF